MRPKGRLALGALVACVALLAIAAVAYAANTYKVFGKGTPYGAGSPAKPLPKKLFIGYQVDSDDGKQPSPVKSYEFRIQGGTQFAKYFPKCTIQQANAKEFAKADAACRKAKVGFGWVRNTTAPPGADLNGPEILTCNLRLTMYNLGYGIALRLDGSPEATDPRMKCVIPIGQSIEARWTKPRVRGKPGSGLKFTVPPNLLHPIPGLDNSVRYVESTINRIVRTVTIRGRKRKVPYIGSIACANKTTRYVQVVFTSEAGQTTVAEQKTRC